MTDNATPQQVSYLTRLRDAVRDVAANDPTVAEFVRRRLGHLAAEAAIAAKAPGTLARHQQQYPWVPFGDDNHRSAILDRLLALREHLAALNDEEIAALDKDGASALIELAKVV